MVGTILGTILGTAAQIGSRIYGAVQSSKANKEAMNLIKQQREDNKKWYEQKMSEDYLKRPDIQNVLRKQRDLVNEQYQRAKATSVVAGGTDEALALQQQQANETLGDTTANIAAQSTDYKEQVENAYRTQDATLNQQEIGIKQAQAQNIATAAGQMGKAVSGLVTPIGEGVATSSSTSLGLDKSATADARASLDATITADAASAIASGNPAGIATMGTRTKDNSNENIVG